MLHLNFWLPQGIAGTINPKTSLARMEAYGLLGTCHGFEHMVVAFYTSFSPFCGAGTLGAEHLAFKRALAGRMSACSEPRV